MKVHLNRKSAAATAARFLLVGLLLLSAGEGRADEPFEIICDGLATDISADGSVIVGVTPETDEIWQWTKNSGRVLLGRSSGSANEIDWGTPDVSDDGRVISATVLNQDTGTESLARWSESGGWEFPDRGSDEPGAKRQKRNSLARGLSGDGSTLVGQVRFSNNSTCAATWPLGRGLVPLGAEQTDSRANDINFDGTVVVGWSADPESGIWQPTAWTGDRQVILAATKAFCEAAAVNSAGNIIVGQSYDESRDQRAAALWLNSDFGWVQEWLGTLPGTIGGYGQSMALDLTDDGHTIVGYNNFDPNRSVGFIWTLADGLHEAHGYLADRGVQFPEGFRIKAITGITRDGSHLTGYGEDTTFWPHQTRSFLVRAEALPREKPRAKNILPAGTDISNPFKTKKLD